MAREQNKLSQFVEAYSEKTEKASKGGTEITTMEKVELQHLKDVIYSFYNPENGATSENKSSFFILLHSAVGQSEIMKTRTTADEICQYLFNKTMKELISSSEYLLSDMENGRNGLFNPRSSGYKNLPKPIGDYQAEYDGLLSQVKDIYSELPPVPFPIEQDVQINNELGHSINKGSDSSIVPEKYININGEKFKKIVGDYFHDNNDHYPRFKAKELEAHAIQAHSLDEMCRFLDVFGGSILTEYLSDDNTGSTNPEARCGEVSFYTSILMRRFGITNFRTLSTTEGFRHACNIVKIKDPNGPSSQFFRFDFTFNQFTKEFSGLVVMPVLHGDLYTQEKPTLKNENYCKPFRLNRIIKRVLN
jgi:hypothetical protein